MNIYIYIYIYISLSLSLSLSLPLSISLSLSLSLSPSLPLSLSLSRTSLGSHKTFIVQGGSSPLIPPTDNLYIEAAKAQRAIEYVFAQVGVHLQTRRPLTTSSLQSLFLTMHASCWTS